VSKKRAKYKKLIVGIENLERELAVKKKEAAQLEEENYAVKAPDVFQAQFLSLQRKMADYFSDLNFDPSSGEITIQDERYLLTRSSSLSYDFFQGLLALLDENTGESTFELAYDLLFDIAQIIGKKDAEKYATKLGLNTPEDRLSAGPEYFAFTGWARVEILPESNPSTDENFLLKFRHLNSFEAEAWKKEKGYSEDSVCAMSAGYSSGWCSYSYGIELTAIEITCAAKKNEEQCEFIMAHPAKIGEYTDAHRKRGKSLPSFFERNFFKKQLAEKKALIRSAEEFSKVGSINVNFSNDTADWSIETYKVFGINPKQKGDLYKAYLSRLDAPTKDLFKEKIDLLKLTGQHFEMKHILHCPDEVKKWVVSSFSPIKNKKDVVVKMRGLVQDITHHMTGDRELDHFFKISADLLCIANHKGHFVRISPAWTELLGYTEKELLSQPYINFVHPDDRNITSDERRRLPGDYAPSTFENRYVTKSGEIVYLSWHSRVDELTKLIYANVRDVTKQRKKEERLLSSLGEKELLLREIHHRVKNNLQVISSLLSLQSGMKKSNVKLEQLYEDSQNRIKSMSAIHEMFYRSESLDKIEFPVYAKKLVIDLIYSLKGKENNINLDFSTDDIQFDLDTAIPLGLIVNEIITNALKHGFSQAKDGTITVHFKKSDSGEIHLFIGDSGEGSKDNPLEQQEETLGMMMINDLVEQIGASITYLSEEKGINYLVVIPAN
jgi:PAS domain S-box-containing protein